MIALMVAHNTFREAIRDRVLGGVVSAGIVLLVVTQLLSPLALGESRRLTVDLGLSAISMLGLLVVLVVGTSMVAKEIERRTLYNLLSRPIARHDYLIGKWAGLSAALAVAAVLLGVALGIVLLIRGEVGSLPSVIQAVYLAALELILVSAVATMFSAISTPLPSALYTLGIYLVGQWSYDLRSFADGFPPALARMTEIAANLVPNLPLFNMRTLAAEAEMTTAVHLGIATLYAATYCACALCVATAAFEGRDLK